MRKIFVGDVHGCFVELEDLLKACEYDEETDELIFVGDLVGKGPESLKVVQFVMQTKNCYCVKGNHEQFVLDCRKALRRNGNLDGYRVDPEYRELIDQLDDEEWDFLENLPLYLTFPGLLVVHAGLLPHIPVEEQDGSVLLYIRNIVDGKPSSKDEAGVPWASLWEGPPRVIFGHDAVRCLQQYPWATGLDTGCCYGNRLTALILPEDRLVSVPARKMYSVPTITLKN